MAPYLALVFLGTVTVAVALVPALALVLALVELRAYLVFVVP